MFYKDAYHNISYPICFPYNVTWILPPLDGVYVGMGSKFLAPNLGEFLTGERDTSEVRS